jgi:hypothetical protein
MDRVIIQILALSWADLKTRENINTGSAINDSEKTQCSSGCEEDQIHSWAESLYHRTVIASFLVVSMVSKHYYHPLVVGNLET